MKLDDRMKRVDKSIVKQLERSIKLNCELRISVWNDAIEAAANKVESAGNILLAHSVRELKK